MDKYERLQRVRDTDLKRLLGVKRHTFEAMVEEYETYHVEKKRQGGKPNTLSPAMQVVLMLEYYREYRSMAHLGFDYGVSESTVSRTIAEVEKVLVDSGRFSLPGKKALYQDEGINLEYIVIDATECPVQRPKKSSDAATAERKNATAPKGRS